MTTSPVVLGASVFNMVKACESYARAHRTFIGSDLADDAVLGPCFASVVDGILGLLNGELGKHDGGTLWNMLDKTAKYAGWPNIEKLRNDA